MERPENIWKTCNKNKIDTLLMGEHQYRESLPYADFGTWKKPRYAKFALVGL